MLKILTTQIREQIYYLLVSHRLFLAGQKGWPWKTKGTNNLLYIDQQVLKKAKMRWKNVAMAWIDNKNGMVLQTEIMQCLKMYKISDKILNFITNVWGQNLPDVIIQRAIFPGDSLIAIMPLNHILKKCFAGFKFSKSQEKINHLVYMGDIKLFTKNEKELKTRIQTIRIYNQVVRMEVIIVENGHDDLSSNSGWGCWYFLIGKVCIILFSL